MDQKVTHTERADKVVQVGDYVMVIDTRTQHKIVKGIIGVVIRFKPESSDLVEIKTPADGVDGLWTIHLSSPCLSLTKLSAEEYFYSVLKYRGGVIE